MFYLFLIIIILIIIVAPSLWVTRTIKKFSEPNDRYDFTGSTFARKLLDALNLQDIDVESTELGDHYDPTSRTVRLTADKMESRSLTAITIAAHEVGMHISMRLAINHLS